MTEDKALAVEFFFALEDELSDEEFREVSRMIKKTSRFFPVPAQLYELKNAAIDAIRRRSTPGDLLALEAPEEGMTDLDRNDSQLVYEKYVELAKSGMSYEAMANEMESFKRTLLRN